MLRCTVILLMVAGCVATPELPPNPASTGVPADADSATEEALANPGTVAEVDEEGGTEIIVESETFQYSMTLRGPDGSNPRIMCSYGKRTGSHHYQKYCRTTEVSDQEREAARKFFEEARRRGD
ncbi:MAG: hypothetical protein OEQ74_08965 [Gammaproteobacteria bacterium]|nr:hypothetical protein [Gammaproteobacteria bacterium]